MSARIPEDSTHSYIMLVEGLEEMSAEPSNPYLRSFSLDFLELIDEVPVIGQKINNALRNREDIDQVRERQAVNASYAGNLALRSVHAALFNEPGYPETHREQGTWKSDIERCVLEGEFCEDIWLWDVMSNVESRYATLKVCATLLEERQQRPLRIIDIGSSQGHGGKMIAGNLPFTPPADAKQGQGLADFGSRLERQVVCGEFINVDQVKFSHDIRAQEWAKACSIPPHEKTPERIEQYDTLDKLTIPDFVYVQNEIGRPSFLEYEPGFRGRFDIVFISTALYQMSPGKRELALRQANDILAPGGIIIIQDHVRVSPGNDRGLDFIDHWYNPGALPYRTVLYDSTSPQQGLVEVFRWTTGRCTKGTIPGPKAQRALERLKQSH